MALSDTDIETFREQGFLAIEGVFRPAQMAALRSAASEIVEGFDVDAHRTVFRTDDRDSGRDDYFFDSSEAVHCFLEAGALDADGSLNRDKSLAINKIGHALHDRETTFRTFCSHPWFGAALRDLGYGAPVVMQTMYIFKQPGIGGEVRWHQDASYLISAPPGVTGVWVAVEDATETNGCLWMQPGAHRLPLRERYTVDWRAREGRLETLDDTPWQGSEPAVPVPVPAGSVVLFHERMPHYSSENRSQKSRHAFTLHVTEQLVEWSPLNWLQRPTLPPFRL
ncbi:MAG: phytanoyl-CoA dioxygenase family protein [Pseudomonadota bacterium]